jgi:hypothetical protein
VREGESRRTYGAPGFEKGRMCAEDFVYDGIEKRKELGVRELVVRRV